MHVETYLTLSWDALLFRVLYTLISSPCAILAGQLNIHPIWFNFFCFHFPCAFCTLANVSNAIFFRFSFGGTPAIKYPASDGGELSERKEELPPWRIHTHVGGKGVNAVVGDAVSVRSNFIYFSSSLTLSFSAFFFVHTFAFSFLFCGRISFFLFWRGGGGRSGVWRWTNQTENQHWQANRWRTDAQLCARSRCCCNGCSCSCDFRRCCSGECSLWPFFESRERAMRISIVGHKMQMRPTAAKLKDFSCRFSA